MILQAGRFSGEEFLADLFSGPSWEIRGVSWVGEGWRMVEGWRGKWGWLLEEGDGVVEGVCEEVGWLEEGTGVAERVCEEVEALKA